MGVGKLNIWVSDVADPCGTWNSRDEKTRVTVFDCKGILEWQCGRYWIDEGWKPISNGVYKNLPLICGHLQVEVPPGCYWVIAAGSVSDPKGKPIHLNYTTHVGIVQVGCDETACVKLYNPTLRLCWNWFRVGLQISAQKGQIDLEGLKQVETLVEETLLRNVPRQPVERMIERIFDDLVDDAKHLEIEKGQKC